jgi:hypothetical protein
VAGYRPRKEVPIRQCFLKTLSLRADAVRVADANLFPDEGGFTPPPAWQIIEAARRRYLTGELTLPTTRRPGVPRATGWCTSPSAPPMALPIRLMMEGDHSRADATRHRDRQRVEHVGRMFEADASIDRASVELCAELFTDDVLTAVANTVVRATSWPCTAVTPVASTAGTRTRPRKPPGRSCPSRDVDATGLAAPRSRRSCTRRHRHKHKHSRERGEGRGQAEVRRRPPSRRTSSMPRRSRRRCRSPDPTTVPAVPPPPITRPFP